MLQLLDLLVTILRPENEVSVPFSCLDPAETTVPQDEIFSLVAQDFLMQLRTLCDSVLHTYLSKVADTAEKRNYLYALYTPLKGSRLGTSLEGSLDDIVQILELYPPTFQPCEDHRLLFIVENDCRNPSITKYLGDFVRNPERSRSFHYDPGLWSTLVATRCIKYLRTTFNPGPR